jgi:SAM-dependent methyltransferase
VFRSLAPAGEPCKDGAVTFEVAADAYDRFMGRYSSQLGAQLADFAGVRAGQRVLDVGCGPGVLTGELARRVGAEAVVAVDPSAAFVAAAQARHPGVDVRRAQAEDLPFEDGSFDAVLAQLVVHFMHDPVAGLTEMARVTRAGGTVAASVWDHAGDRTPLAVFWTAAHEFDPRVHDESDLPGARSGHLGELFAAAGLDSIRETTVEASLTFSSFEDWWEPFTLGVGPAGGYAATLDEEALVAVRERCRELLGPVPFTVEATAWAARAEA